MMTYDEELRTYRIARLVFWVFLLEASLFFATGVAIATLMGTPIALYNVASA
jgi:hypothetical protein